MTRILIVEDDPTFRDRFATIVRSCPEFALVAAVGSCAEACVWLRRSAPNVVGSEREHEQPRADQQHALGEGFRPGGPSTEFYFFRVTYMPFGDGSQH